MKKRNSYLLLASLFLFLSSCISDDEGSETPSFPDVDRGSIVANRLKITFYPRNNASQRSTFEYYDPDGSGGNAPTINETITLSMPTSGSFFDYLAEIEIMNDNDTVTSNVENLGTKYIICYRDHNPSFLRRNSSNKDSEGRDLGTETEWTTVANNNAGSGKIRITMNYQGASKQGVCDDGFRILEASMNYIVQ